MTRRCKPGIRARIILGANAGRVVVVVRYYFGETVSAATWPTALFPWVVTSLGGPLRTFLVDNGVESSPSMTIVVDDCELEPLRDDDDPDESDAVERLPDLRVLRDKPVQAVERIGRSVT